MIIFIQPLLYFVFINTSFLNSVSEYIPVIYNQMELMEDKADANFFLKTNTAGTFFNLL